MDISNMNVDQLKIVAYDLMEKIDVLDKDLNLVRSRIAYLLQLNQEVAAGEVVSPAANGMPVSASPTAQKKHRSA